MQFKVPFLASVMQYMKLAETYPLLYLCRQHVSGIVSNYASGKCALPWQKMWGLEKCGNREAWGSRNVGFEVCGAELRWVKYH